MKKNKQQDLRSRLMDYKIGLSNRIFDGKEEAIKSMVDAARELGFVEAQEQVVSQLEDILEGKE